MQKRGGQLSSLSLLLAPVDRKPYLRCEKAWHEAEDYFLLGDLFKKDIFMSHSFGGDKCVKPTSHCLPEKKHEHQTRKADALQRKNPSSKLQ